MTSREANRGYLLAFMVQATYHDDHRTDGGTADGTGTCPRGGHLFPPASRHLSMSTMVLWKTANARLHRVIGLRVGQLVINEESGSIHLITKVNDSLSFATLCCICPTQHWERVGYRNFISYWHLEPLDQ